MEEQDLEIKPKFFKTTPYKSDDSDLTWRYSSDLNKSQNSSPGNQTHDGNILENRHREDEQIENVCKSRYKKEQAQTSKTAHHLVWKPESEPASCSGFWNQQNHWESKLELPESDTDEFFRDLIKRKRKLSSGDESNNRKKFSPNGVSTSVATSTPYRDNASRISFSKSNSTRASDSDFENTSSCFSGSSRDLELSNYEATDRSFSSTWEDVSYTSPASQRNRRSGSYRSHRKSWKTERRSQEPLPENAPCYKDHQLLGDSQLLRFSEQMLRFKSSYIHTGKRYTRCLGYCVSGQKIQDLENQVSQKQHHLSEKLIVLIGTNDMIQNTRLESMCETYRNLLNKLRQTAKRIVLLTVPPVPKLARNGTHLLKLRKFNHFLNSLVDEEKVFLVELSNQFMSDSGNIFGQYFEEVYNRSPKPRPDLIHLNREGFKVLKRVLDEEYFSKYL